jgi:hypothetical protein
MSADSAAMKMTRGVSLEDTMSRAAEEFRQQTKDFWSHMDQKSKAVATEPKGTPMSSRNTQKTTSRNTKKQIAAVRADPPQKTKKIRRAH